MTEKENVRYIVEIEQKYPVEKWVVNGQHVWPIIRSEITVYNRRYYRVTSNSNINSFKRIFLTAKSLLKFSMYNFIKKEQKDVLILHDNLDRNIKLKDGTFYDKVLDPIYDLLKQENISILNLEESMNGDNKPYGEVTSLEIILIIIRIINKVSRQKGTVQLSRYEEFMRDIPAELSANLSIDKLQHNIGLINRISKFMAWLLKKHDVKLVIFECWYGTYRYALSMACKRLGIKSIDIQHGRAGGTGQEFYSSWTKFPENSNYEIIPDVFWTWTESDKQAIDNWNTNNIIVYNGGKLIFNTLNIIRNLVDLSAMKKIDKSKPVILFTVQPSNIYPDWLVQYIKDSSEQYIWMLRYHLPLDNLQQLFVSKFTHQKNVYINGMECILLELLLSECDVHITMSSSVIVDAAMMNKPSIMLNRKFISTFDEYLANGICCLASNADELDSAIRRMMNKNVSNIGKRYITNAEKNINFIKSLMEQSSYDL